MIIHGPSSRPARVLLLVSVLCVAAGCSRPLTDIVATNTEDVGDFDVVRRTMGEEFAGQVCVARGADPGTIAARIVMQLQQHNFAAITLDLFPRSAAGPIDVARIVWTPKGGQQPAVQRREPVNPCEREPAEGHSDRR